MLDRNHQTRLPAHAAVFQLLCQAGVVLFCGSGRGRNHEYQGACMAKYADEWRDAGRVACFRSRDAPLAFREFQCTCQPIRAHRQGCPTCAMVLRNPVVMASVFGDCKLWNCLHVFPYARLMGGLWASAIFCHSASETR